MANDTQYETFQHYGTDAERLAFTPTPAGGIQPIYIWYSTDTGATWVYDTSWHSVAGSGGGLPASVQGDLFYASAANTVVALTKDTNATRYLANTGASNNPAWAQVNLANGVTGVLPVANGGYITKGTPVVIAHAAIITLPTTPVTVIPALGAGIIAAPLYYIVQSNVAAGVYMDIDAAGFAGVRTTTTGINMASYIANDATSTPALVGLTDLLGNFAASTVFLSAFRYDVDPLATNWGGIPNVMPTADVANHAHEIYVDNGGTGNFSGGNAANTLTITPYYVVVP